jgi:hypothetical protein
VADLLIGNFPGSKIFTKVMVIPKTRHRFFFLLGIALDKGGSGLKLKSESENFFQPCKPTDQMIGERQLGTFANHIYYDIRQVYKLHSTSMSSHFEGEVSIQNAQRTLHYQFFFGLYNFFNRPQTKTLIR